MARIKGVDIPNDKRIEISLTYIYGIGRQLSKTILNDAKVDFNKKAKDLTDDELSRIRKEVDKYLTEGDLRRKIWDNTKTLRTRNRRKRRKHSRKRNEKTYLCIHKKHARLKQF